MDKIWSLIKKKLIDKNKILIGISGIDLSGKTTIANTLKDFLKEKYSVDIISLSKDENIIKDSFTYKNPTKYYYDNAYDLKLLEKNIKASMKKNDVVIVEGGLLFKNTTDIKFNFKIWIDCTFTTSIERAPVESKDLYENYFSWIQRQHFSIDNPKGKVSLIFKNDKLLENKPKPMVDLVNNKISFYKMKWFNEPDIWKLEKDGLFVETNSTTDFWQRTHYGFRNDNGHMLYIETDKDFIMTTKVLFNAIHQFDQCGLAVRIDEDNWIKTSMEYDLENPLKLGVVVTNLGYSDWSMEEVNSEIGIAEFRITRERNDYIIENKLLKTGWRQLRICHLHSPIKTVKCGIYCCSPINNGYNMVFQDINITEKIF